MPSFAYLKNEAASLKGSTHAEAFDKLAEIVSKLAREAEDLERQLKAAEREISRLSAQVRGARK